MKFSTLNLNESLFLNLEKQQISDLTAVQELAIPAIMEGRDCLAIAPTGTGKTEAFAIPMIQKLLQSPECQPASVLILLPTRELCIQTKNRLAQLIAQTSLHVACFYGGGTYDKQLDAYSIAQIIVSTPGRLLDFINQGLVHLHTITTFVIDEFDQLLNMGFAVEVNKIMGALPTEKQSIFISATKTAEIEKIVKKRLKNQVEIVLKNDIKQAKTEELVLYVDKNHKKNLLRFLLETRIKDQAIVFTRTIHGVERIETDLRKHEISAVGLYGNKSQQERENIITQFRNRELRVLIATDLLARGIDFPHLQAIINYEVPDSTEIYIHRKGRTGRSTADGTALTFCDAEDNQKWIKLQLDLNRQIKIDDQHPFLLSWEKMLSSSQNTQRKGESKSRKRR